MYLHLGQALTMAKDKWKKERDYSHVGEMCHGRVESFGEKKRCLLSDGPSKWYRFPEFFGVP